MDILIGLVCICLSVYFIADAVKTIIYSVKAIKEAYMQNEIIKILQQYTKLFEDWIDELRDDL